MKQLVLIILIPFLLIISTAGFSQQVISPAGTHATGTNVQLSWTIGEPVIKTLTGTGVMLTQGFHQAMLFVDAVDPGRYAGIKLSVFPNPVRMDMNLEITGTGTYDLDYQLFDVAGKLLVMKKIELLPERINMGVYPSGFYLLRVSRKGGEPLKTFKIVKAED